jgi:hypothetical protein
VPERFRKCVWLWSLAVVDDRRGRALWSQLPSWCHLALESEAGELEALSPSTRGAHWALMTLKPQHRRLHLSFADAPKGFSLARSPIEDIRFIKASELLRPSGHLIHPISLKLDQGVDEAPELLRFEE